MPNNKKNGRKSNNRKGGSRGNGPGELVTFSGRDWYGTLSSGIVDSNASLGIINPYKNNTLFERLSKVAQDFAMFRFRKLVFKFRGTSPSTSQGTLAFCAVVTDGFGGGLAVSNEASVKNTENAMILRGDRTGTYRVKCNSQWLALDTNNAANTVGNSLGTLYHFIDGTATAGLLTWDVTVDYVCQFSSPVRPGTIDLTQVSSENCAGPATTPEEIINFYNEWKSKQ